MNELKRYGPAQEAYSSALRIDPANMIARRNLQKMELLRHRSAPVEDEANGDGTLIPRTTVFIEEVGKTWVDELADPIAMEDLAEISSGEPLQLEVEGEHLYVACRDGRRLGEIEARTAERVIELMEGGNRFEVYALGLSAQSLRVILREVYRDPSQAGKVAFPRQVKATRAYLRERDILRQRDEADFLLLDDEDEDEDEDEVEPEGIEEEDSPEADAEPLLSDALDVVDEEEPQT
jgi:hypothetical protein